MSRNHDENRIEESRDARKRSAGGSRTSFGGASANRSRRSGNSEREKRKARIENFTSDEDKTDDRDTYFDKYTGGARYTYTSEHSKKSTQKTAYLNNNGNNGVKDGNKKRPPSSGSERKRNPPQRADDTMPPPTKIKDYTVKQRKIRTMLFYIGLFLVIVASAVVLSVTVIFKTDEIVVVGAEDTPYTAEQIISSSGLSYGENIFMSGKKAAAKSIVDKFPYIESAEVTIKIPGTQVITVESAVPSYEVAVSGGYAVISGNGRVLEHIGAASGTIPLLKGVTVTDTEIGDYIKFEKESTQQILSDLIECINENEIPNIYGIDISNTADIKLNYDNRITISLGVPEDVSYKLRTAITIINEKLASTDKGDLDVSLANSDRKASYFTPIYSNTISIEDSVSSASSSGSDTEAETDTEMLSDTGSEDVEIYEGFYYISSEEESLSESE